MILDPKIDLVFKKLFATEENKDLLMSLINSILPENEQITKVILKNPYQTSDYVQGRLSILDIKAEDTNGVLYDIEMQMRYFDIFPKRTLYYWSKMFGSQLDNTNIAYMKEYEKDHIFRRLRKCIVISFMNFSYFRNDKKHVRCFSIKDKETNKKHKALDYLDLYFVELPKFKKYLSMMETVKTIQDDWLTFLKTAWNEKGELQSFPTESPLVAKAREKLRVMGLSEEEKAYYEGQQKTILDHNAAMYQLKKDRKKVEDERQKVEAEKQKVEAEKQNNEAEKQKVEIESNRLLRERAELEKLRETEKLAIVRRLLQTDANNEFISLVTQISEEEIEKLRKKLQ